MGSSPDTVSLAQLDSLVQSAQALIQQILASTRALAAQSTSSSSSVPSTVPSTASSTTATTLATTPSTASATASSASPLASPAPHLNPISLARDAATLIRSDVTKISLLIINDPFSPSAITPFLTSIARPLLALLAALQSSDPALYTTPFRAALSTRTQRLLSELALFLAKIPADGKPLSGVRRDGSAADRGSIPATGLVWAACDAVAALADMGVAGFIAHEIATSKDTLDDIMQELKEWSEQDPEDDDDDDDDDDDNGNDGHDDDAHSADEFDDGGAQSLLDNLMAQRAIPADDPNHIRPRLDTTLRNLRMIVLLYQAIIKRRIKKLPSLPLPVAAATTTTSTSTSTSSSTSTSPSITQKLDHAVVALRNLPDSFGDLAAAFYDMRTPAIDDAMAQCFREAASASEILSKNWTGGTDEFTQWSDKFRSEMSKT